MPIQERVFEVFPKNFQWSFFVERLQIPPRLHLWSYTLAAFQAMFDCQEANRHVACEMRGHMDEVKCRIFSMQTGPPQWKELIEVLAHRMRPGKITFGCDDCWQSGDGTHEDIRDYALTLAIEYLKLGYAGRITFHQCIRAGSFGPEYARIELLLTFPHQPQEAPMPFCGMSGRPWPGRSQVAIAVDEDQVNAEYRAAIDAFVGSLIEKFYCREIVAAPAVK